MTRRELSDDEWELIEPFLPIGRYGPFPQHLREQFEGVIWRFRTGSQWREMPEEFGAWQTVYDRFAQWRDIGVFAALMEGMIAEAARRGQADMSWLAWTPRWPAPITTRPGWWWNRRSWRHWTGPRRGKRGHGDRANAPVAGGSPAGKSERAERRRLRRRRRARLEAAALGRSRGGLTSKVHLAADRRCRPLAFVLTPRQAADSPRFIAVLEKVRVRGPVGRPRTRPDAVAADTAYSSRARRAYLRRRGIKAVIPEKADQAANRKKRGRDGGRPVAHIWMRSLNLWARGRTRRRRAIVRGTSRGSLPACLGRNRHGRRGCGSPGPSGLCPLRLGNRRPV